jgi:hypothetical protein
MDPGAQRTSTLVCFRTDCMAYLTIHTTGRYTIHKASCVVVHHLYDQVKDHGLSEDTYPDMYYFCTLQRHHHGNAGMNKDGEAIQQQLEELQSTSQMSPLATLAVGAALYAYT